MSHFKSVTTEADGRFVNFRTVRKGKQLSVKEAFFKAAQAGELGNGFKTQKMAVDAAIMRSHKQGSGQELSPHTKKPDKSKLRAKRMGKK